MTLASDRLFRVLLLIVCVGLWVVALPTFALGIVGPAVTRDVATAGSVSVAGRLPHPERDPFRASGRERAGRTL